MNRSSYFFAASSSLGASENTVMTFDDTRSVVTPWRLTSSGSFGVAMFTRFCTSTDAMLMSVPSSNVTLSVYEPSLADVLSM
jgi:hypothetical protein